MTKNKGPGSRYWALVEPHWIPLNTDWDDCDQFLRDLRKIPVEVVHLYAGHWCQSEVCNGGFKQFFDNTTGILAPEALAGFEAIGIEEWAALLRQAMRFFGEPYPRDRETRQALLEASACLSTSGRSKIFDKLDDQFYEWLRPEYERWDRMADEYAERYERRAADADRTDNDDSRPSEE